MQQSLSQYPHLRLCPLSWWRPRVPSHRPGEGSKTIFISAVSPISARQTHHRQRRLCLTSSSSARPELISTIKTASVSMVRVRVQCHARELADKSEQWSTKSCVRRDHHSKIGPSQTILCLRFIAPSRPAASFSLRVQNLMLLHNLRSFLHYCRIIHVTHTVQLQPLAASSHVPYCTLLQVELPSASLCCPLVPLQLHHMPT